MNDIRPENDVIPSAIRSCSPRSSETFSRRAVIVLMFRSITPASEGSFGWAVWTFSRSA